MRITFHIDYHDEREGDALYLNVCHEGKVTTRYELSQNDNYQWVLTLDVRDSDAEYLDYYYTVVAEGKVRHTEWMAHPHRLHLAQDGVKVYEVYDRWNEMPDDAYRYTTAFTEGLAKRQGHKGYARKNPAIIRLKVNAPQLDKDERLVLTGAHPVLGEWQVDRGIRCVEEQPNQWVCCIDAEYTAGEELEYKFVAVKGERMPAFVIPGMEQEREQQEEWEKGGNRRITVPRLRKGEVTDYEVYAAYFDRWNERLVGTSVAVEQLRTDGTKPCGDFGDVRAMIDWLKMTGQKVLHLMPVNDMVTVTQEEDNGERHDQCVAVSRYAINPAYFDLDGCEKNGRKDKWQCIQGIYNKVKYGILRSDDFTRWMKRESVWIEDYAEYCCERDGIDDRGLVYYVQYELQRQLTALRDYARSKGVILMGTLPVDVLYESQDYDVWEKPERLHESFDAVVADAYLRCDVKQTIGEEALLALPVSSLQEGRKYHNPAENEWLSISSPGLAGDMTLAQWWQATGRTTDIYGGMLGRRDETPQTLEPWLAQTLIRRCLHTPSMVCLVQLADWQHAMEISSDATLQDMMEDIRRCDDIAEIIKLT